MTKNRLYKVAHEATIHAGQYAFAGRHLRKRDMRRTWITRINAALRGVGVTYSRFIPALKKANINMDRKVLSDLATTNPEAFKKIVESAGFATK